ncbi:MAG: FtsX-like permease family protein [Bacteroidota bacterium]
MNTQLFVAKKIIKGTDGKSMFSQPVIRLAIASMSLGVAVMLVTIMIVTGFKEQITQKVSGFAAHIQLSSFSDGENLDESSFSKNQSFLPEIKKLPDVKHVQVYARKAGILKTKDEFEGVVLKGIGDDYDFTYLNSHLQSGKIPTLKKEVITNDILISQNLSSKLQLKTGDSFLVYFLENSKKVRKFTVCGIYNTGLAEEFDNIYLFCDIRVIQKLNNWSENDIAGYEIYTTDFKNVDQTATSIYNLTGYNFNCKSIKDIYPQIFNWLELQNINVMIIICLMMLVAGINMIATLLIIILDNTLSIGLLKALGATSGFIRKVYLRVSIYIVARGLLIGNLIGISLCFLQYYFEIIKLPQESYYVSSVPVSFNLWSIVLVNLTTCVICFLMLVIPSGIISKVSPVKVLQFS